MGFKLVDEQWLSRHAKDAAVIYRAQLTKDTVYTPVELKTILEQYSGHSHTQENFNAIRERVTENGVLVEAEDEE